MKQVVSLNADLFLILYSCLKAFLPLPSIEAILVPFCLKNPHLRFYYALISGIGTFLGANIGYELAVLYGERIALKFVSEDTLRKGRELMDRHGVASVVIGSITPIPDFILAYLAGIGEMNRLLFLFLDGFCRFLRSLAVVMGLNQMNQWFDLDRYANLLSVIILVYFAVKLVFKKQR